MTNEDVIDEIDDLQEVALLKLPVRRHIENDNKKLITQVASEELIDDKDIDRRKPIDVQREIIQAKNVLPLSLASSSAIDSQPMNGESLGKENGDRTIIDGNEVSEKLTKGTNSNGSAMEKSAILDGVIIP